MPWLMLVPDWAKKAAAALLVVLVLIVGGLFAYWRVTATIDGMVKDAAVTATALSDAKWKAKIEESNAAVERERADNAIRVAAMAQAEADAEARAEAAEKELEIKNAALPDGNAIGLDVGRVRLLDREP